MSAPPVNVRVIGWRPADHRFRAAGIRVLAPEADLEGRGRLLRRTALLAGVKCRIEAVMSDRRGVHLALDGEALRRIEHADGRVGVLGDPKENYDGVTLSVRWTNEGRITGERGLSYLGRPAIAELDRGTIWGDVAAAVFPDGAVLEIGEASS